MDVATRYRDSVLCLRTAPTTLSGLLGGFGTLAVPPFQRAYAWEEAQVSAFLSDIERCRLARLGGDSTPHYFGAIVSSLSAVPGSSRPHKILIDGQQRLATLYMLIVHLRRRFEQASKLAAAEKDGERERVLEARAIGLLHQFEITRDVEFTDPKTVRKLSLSNADNAFFVALTTGENCSPDRVSHERLKTAFEMIGDHFNRLLERATDSGGHLRSLEPLYQAFIRDWSVVHLAVDDRRHANLIFRVLNTRGIRITEGELLRSRTLEAAAPQLEAAKVSAMSDAWDSILIGEPIVADEALGMVFQARYGRKPSVGKMDSDYETECFPAVLETEGLTKTEAENLHRAVLVLREDMRALARLGSGYPPFEDANTIDAVSRSRLHALITILKQSYCLPLLLAGRSLNPNSFASLCDVVERFAFRYSVIARAPIYPVDAIFSEHAILLSNEPGTFKLGKLVEDLQGLLDDFANDEHFAQCLRSLRYGQNLNPAIRYLLILLEQMHAWWKNNPQGKPVCRDPTRILDFVTMTIEHVQSPKEPGLDPDLIPFIDTLGNLTVLSSGQNDAQGNKAFAEKKPILEDSNLGMNRELAENDVWSIETIQARTDELVRMCLAVFTLTR